MKKVILISILYIIFFGVWILWYTSNHKDRGVKADLRFKNGVFYGDTTNRHYWCFEKCNDISLMPFLHNKAEVLFSVDSNGVIICDDKYKAINSLFIALIEQHDTANKYRELYDRVRHTLSFDRKDFIRINDTIVSIACGDYKVVGDSLKRKK